jgi:transglutaminase-like putative cysteine protease
LEIGVEMKIGCKLRYEMTEATAFVFQIEAAKADSQTVREERLIFPADAASDVYADPVTLTRKVRVVLGPGPAEVVYDAAVDVDATAFDPAQVLEFDFADLPLEYLEYLAASRYCPSDIFTKLAFETFGKCPRGHTRVTAICDWIFKTITYASGSTGPSSTSADVYKSKMGVCRDFAHLGISLCRAVGIPARYASVYADALSPQDFHAVFQAYLNGPKGGEWFAFDASRMSSVDALVRIAAGRDAADVAFAWPQGAIKSQPPEVWADAPGRAHNLRTPLAVSS